MSYIQKSPQHSLAGPCLSDVRESIRRDPDLAPHLRDDLLSALNTVAVVLERDLADIPAAPQLLRARLLEAMPGKFGKRPARWNNVRSLVLRAVTRTVATYPGRQTKELDPAWYAKALTLKMRFQCVRLSSLIHFCSDQGIPPDAVDQSTFDAFKDALGRSLRKNPAATYAVMVQAWNYAVRTVPGWPAFIVARQPRRRDWTLPWSTFPALAADCETWLGRLSDPDPVGSWVDDQDPLNSSAEDTDRGDGLPDKPLSPATVKLRRQMVREVASALVLQGRDPATLQAIQDLGTLPAFKAAVRYLVHQRRLQRGGHVLHVAWMLKCIAKYEARALPTDLTEMARIIRRLRPKQTGMTMTNERRLTQLDDPRNLKAFLELPEKLLQAAIKTKFPRKAALLVEMALAILLLQMAPMRIKNLVGLDLEKHFIGWPNGSHVYIQVPGDDVKNDTALNYPLPDCTVTLLRTYVQSYRHCLVSMPTTALFPGRKNGFRQCGGFGDKITRTIWKYTGLRINPHLFRHIAAKLFGDNPGGYEVIRRLLGHRSTETTMTFYANLKTPAAVRLYQDHVLRLRKESRP